MPADLTGDPIGPTGLCNHHRVVVRQMANHGHIDTDATMRAAQDIQRQCCAWRTKEDQ